MKKIIAVILTVALLSCAFIIPVSAVDNAENEQLYLDSFKKLYLGEEGFGAELLFYEELYYSKDNNGNVEWAFIHAQTNMFCPEIVDRFFHGVHVQQANIYVPFEFGYGVYDVKEDRFYDLTEVSYYNQTHDTPKYEYAFDLFKSYYKPENTGNQYEDAFKNWSKTKYGEECMTEGYKYDELCTHYNDDGSNWVLVEACYYSIPEPAEPTWLHIGGIGGRTVFGPSIGNCFLTGYGVYDVNDKTFYGFEQFADNDCTIFTTEFDKLPFDASKYDGLIDALAELNIGYMTGDANKDNKVDILDATLVQKVASGKAQIGYGDRFIVDVNNDYTVDILDATAIQRYAVSE